ncbi:MAG: type II toxin-antitoxin system HicB family antitoxin [Gemmatimonadaceae bacterium]
MRSFTAVIERDQETRLFVGYIPGWPGAHSQGVTLDELRANLREVVDMLLGDGDPDVDAEFVGTQTLEVARVARIAEDGTSRPCSSDRSRRTSDCRRTTSSRFDRNAPTNVGADGAPWKRPRAPGLGAPFSLAVPARVCINLKRRSTTPFVSSQSNAPRTSECSQLPSPGDR